jgi:hypothetical protein
VKVTSRTHTAFVAAAIALAAMSTSCGDVVRQGRSPVSVVIQSLVGKPGDAPDTGGNTFVSDVLSSVTTPSPCSSDNPCPMVFNDLGEVTMSLLLKDQGQAGNPASPSLLNQVTFTRYRVEYRRTDGRNTPGVDVPFPIDSAVTFTVPADASATANFELVRYSQKEEAPLRALRNSPTLISTIADVSFYGRDQTGNDVSVTGSIGVTFGNVRQ